MTLLEDQRSADRTPEALGCHRHNWEVGDLADLSVLAVYDHDSDNYIFD